MLKNAEVGNLKKRPLHFNSSITSGNPVKTGKRAGGVRSHGRAGDSIQGTLAGGTLIGVPLGNGLGLLSNHTGLGEQEAKRSGSNVER